MFFNLGKKSNSSPSTIEKSVLLQGKVWNSFIDSSNELLIVETRNEESLKVIFYTIDLNSTKIISSYEHHENGWWLSLKYAFDGFFVLALLNEDSPLSKGVIIIDSKRSTINWKNEDLSFLDGQRNQLMVKDATDECNRNLDIKNGQQIPFKEYDDKEITHPQRYIENTTYFEQTAVYIEQLTKDNARECIEYLETDRLIICSYYKYEETNQSNHLIISDIDGNLLKSFNIQGKKKGIAYDNFTLYKDTLIFAINNEAINLLNLSLL